MKKRALHHPALTALVAVAAILWPYMFSIANTGTTFTLSNRTRYYLHATINNESFVYIAPGGSAIVEITAPTSVFARVRYSPGQAVKGTGEKDVTITETVTSSGGSTTCNDGEGNTCHSTEPTTTSSATPGRWDVQPSDLTIEE